MSNHRPIYAGSGDTWQAKCSCTKRSPVGSHGDAELWFYAHQAEIARIRTHLGTRNPSLKSQQAWFLQQAEDTDNPADDRVLWRQLADELEHYVVARAEPAFNQPQLF